MTRSSSVVRFGRPRRMGLTSARVMAAFAILFGTLSVGLQSTGAQSGDNSFTYDEGGLEWSVTWDDSVWSESTSDSADFGLQGENASLVQFLVLNDVTADPAGCLAGVVPNFEEGAGTTDASAFEDDNGDPVADDNRDYAYEMRTITVDTGGTNLDADVIHACYTLDSSNLLWAVALIPAGSDELEAAYDLFDGIEIAGEPVELGLADVVSGNGGSGNETPEASEARSAKPSADEASPEASRSRRSSSSSRSSASANDEASPEASRSRRSSASNDEASPEASRSRRSSSSARPSASDDAAVGADEGAGTYTSPTFGYSLEWDADAWTVESERDVDTYSLGRDFLQINDLDTSSILFIEGADDSWSDTDDCVATLLDEVNVDPADADLLDGDDGDPFEISGDDRSAVAYQIVSQASNGDDQDEIVMIDCRQDSDSDLIVGFTNRSGFVDDYFGDGYPAVQDILDSLTFSGGGSGAETPVASDRSDEPSSRASTREDATPEASRRGSRSATPEPSNDPSGDTGVDGNDYTSPTYGYELTWDEDIWTVEDESSEDDIDALSLSSDILTLNVTGYNSGDGDPETCLDNYLGVLTDRGNGGSDGEAEIVSGDDGDLIFPSDDGTNLRAYAFYTVDGEDLASDIICVSLSDENILAVEFTTDPQTLADTDTSDQIQDILDGLFF